MCNIHLTSIARQGRIRTLLPWPIFDSLSILIISAKTKQAYKRYRQFPLTKKGLWNKTYHSRYYKFGKEEHPGALLRWSTERGDMDTHRGKVDYISI